LFLKSDAKVLLFLELPNFHRKFFAQKSHRNDASVCVTSHKNLSNIFASQRRMAATARKTPKSKQTSNAQWQGRTQGL